MPAIDLSLCPSCGAQLSALGAQGRLRGTCSACKTPILVAAFPRALDAQLRGQPAELRVNEEQSACFFHPKAVATEACGKCGRFLCSVCDIEVAGSHFCSACLERAEVQVSEPFLVQKLERYDLAASSAFSLIVSIPTFMALLIGLSDSGEAAVAAWFGLAMLVAIFAVPSGLYLIYLSNKPQLAKPKPTYLLIRILVVLGVVWLLSLIAVFVSFVFSAS